MPNLNIKIIVMKTSIVYTTVGERKDPTPRDHDHEATLGSNRSSRISPIQTEPIGTMRSGAMSIGGGSSNGSPKRIRLDRKGRAIIRGGKKHGISFADCVKGDVKLVTQYEVESYKGYNSSEGRKSQCTCYCCSYCTIQ